VKGFNYNLRVGSLLKILEKGGCDSFFVTDETNVTYLSGFLGRDSMLLVTPKKRFLITDSRYQEEARKTARGFETVTTRQSTYDTIRELASANKLGRMAFESMNLPFEVANRLSSVVGKTKLIPSRNSVEAIRAVKEPAEVAAIRRSVKLVKDVLGKALAVARPGVEEARLANMIESWFVRSGARMSFEPIVASGKNAAMPHARPGKTKIRNNSFEMIDLGAKLGLYNSDITRMVALGKQDSRYKKIYGIVARAHDRAIAKVKPGVNIAEVDKAARGHIERSGYGKFFGHATGHGVGMSIHEEPSVSRSNTASLKPGMVFTIEPAIYIPGFGGVRIEDMVLVTEKGCEVLTADS